MRFKTLLFCVCLPLFSIGQNLNFRYHIDKIAIFNGDSQLCEYQFSELCEFSEGLAWAAKGDLYGFVDSNGREIIPFDYVEVSNFYEGVALVARDSGLRFQLINSNGDSLTAHLFSDYTYFKDVYLPVKVEDHWGLLATNGSLVVDTISLIPPVFIRHDFVIVKSVDGYEVWSTSGQKSHAGTFDYISRHGEAWLNGKKYWINLR